MPSTIIDSQHIDQQTKLDLCSKLYVAFPKLCSYRAHTKEGQREVL